jgi:hypothetical protein
MTPLELGLLAALILAAATLYSSVGHAGASGYLAAMALCGLAPGVIKPTALVLNVAVATIATVRFARSGLFRWHLLWPFAVTSVPLALLGGALQLPASYYRPIVGLVLVASAVKLVWPSTAENRDVASDPKRPPILPSLGLGAAIGLLSGLTGVGGGIFLSPLLLFTGWADARASAGVSAAFILVNSVAGLAGNLISLRSLPAYTPLLAAFAVVGGVAGSGLGARRLAPRTLQTILAVVLVVAGAKLLLTR